MSFKDNLISKLNREQGRGDDTSSSSTGNYSFDSLLLIRLIISIALVILSLLIDIPIVLKYVLLIISAIISGYEIIIGCINEILSGNYLCSAALITVATLLTFISGFPSEAASLIILFQIGLILIDYVQYRTKKSAYDFVNNQEAINYIEDLFWNENESKREKTPFEKSIARRFKYIALALVAFAVLYALFCPLLSSFNYRVSIHRAAMILVIATPISVISSLYLSDLVGISYTAVNGVLFKKVPSFEKTAFTSSVIYDIDGILSSGSYVITAINPGRIDSSTFMKMCVHVAYKSSSEPYKSIVGAYTDEISEELCSQFTEIQGLGCKITVNGTEMGLVTDEYCDAKGIYIPLVRSGEKVLYFIMDDQYIGYISLDEISDESALNLFNDLNSNNILSILVTEQDKDKCSKLARSLDVSEFYYDCDKNKKLEIVKAHQEEEHNGKTLYLYNRPTNQHSKADIDVSFARDNQYSDVYVRFDSLDSLVFSFGVSQKAFNISRENVAFSLLIKLILLIMILTGFSNIWFAIFIDICAALATILNTIRVGALKIKDLYDDNEENSLVEDNLDE